MLGALGNFLSTRITIELPASETTSVALSQTNSVRLLAQGSDVCCVVETHKNGQVRMLFVLLNSYSLVTKLSCEFQPERLNHGDFTYFSLIVFDFLSVPQLYNTCFMIHFLC